MSYEPSHRTPPRQERWPNATPGEGWLAYQPAEAGQAPHTAEAASGYSGWGGDRYPAAAGGWDNSRSSSGSRGRTDPGGWESSGGRPQGGRWAGYAQPEQDLGSSAGYPAQHGYAGLRSGTSPVLVAPDMRGEWWRQAGRDDPVDGSARGTGVIIATVTGVLSAAVAMGVATLTAAFVRPQAAPASVLSIAVLDRLPAGLKVMVLAHLGGHGGTVLLLGVIAIIAVAVGCAAKRNVSVGVACLAAAGLLGAFVAVTRPGSRAIDVIPLAAGGAAGIMALLWLARAAAPVTSSRPSYGSRRVPR